MERDGSGGSAAGVVVFVVRVLHDGDGQPSAVVELVRTGEKHRATTLDAIGRLIAELTASARDGEAKRT